MTRPSVDSSAPRARSGALLVASSMVTCVTAACSMEASTERSITVGASILGGVNDTVDRGVVSILTSIEPGRQRLLCTGALVAPNLVITAQHCVARMAQQITCAVTSAIDIVPPASIEVSTDWMGWPGPHSTLRTAAVLTPPGAGSVCGRDLALLVLRDSADPICQPFALRLDEPIRVGEPYLAIGFGATRGDVHDYGVRRLRDGFHVLCAGQGCGDTEVMASEWRGDGGPCPGDSGGPVFDMTGRIIGVSSRGPKTCQAPVYSAVVAHATWLMEAWHGWYGGGVGVW